MTHEATIKHWARELGFDECRIAAAGRATHADAFVEWIGDGKHGDMGWMERSPERRCDPREVLAGCRSVICLAVNYYPGDQPRPGQDQPDYRIARYAWNDDYHDLLEKRLKQFRQHLDSLGGEHKPYVDTGPVLERDFASDAGLGWNGKSTMQIDRRLGTWFFLAEILTTLPLKPDAPFGDHCGKCVACIDACPTGAITAPRQLDARRCISYLTIELRGPIPRHLRHLIGDHVYGCDVCQDVCPWNTHAPLSDDPDLSPRRALRSLSPEQLLQLDHSSWARIFRGSAAKRCKHRGALRNAAVVLGNRRDPSLIPLLSSRLALEPEPLVRGHLAWALGRIPHPDARRALAHALTREHNPYVLDELDDALALTTATHHDTRP